MKANELMISDLVQHQNGNGRILVLAQDGLYLEDKEGCCYACSYDKIRPISLTPEILEKNGFRHGCYVGGYYSPDCPFRVFTKTKGTCGFTTLFDDEIHFSCIFVHQLQHALRLCGIEKTIEL